MSAEVSNSLNQKYFSAKYGNEEFYLYIALYNNEGYYQLLQKNSMLYLEIDDNIFNPFHTATLLIGNDLNVIEKAPNPYVFLGNGRDIIDIEIIPIHTGDFDKDSKNEENKNNLGLKFNFVVTESTDIMYNGTICKKLTLVEYGQYMLAENICNIFDLQKAGAAVGNYMESNGGNAKPTGDVIKSILYSVFNNGVPSEDLFFIDPITKNKIFEQDAESSVNINPYGVVSYAEILNYVLTFHAYNKSPCVLQFDRYQKKFILISFDTLFKNHTKYIIETLRFPSQSQNDGNSKDIYPIIWETFPITFEESKINQFYTESPACKHKVDLAGNGGILSTSRSYKSMVFNLGTLNSDNFMKTYYDLFVKPFKDEFKKNGNEKFEVFPNFYPNPNTKNNYNTHKGTLPPALDEKKFLNQKLSSLLYLNNVYQFKLIGKTHRKSLSFIDVNKTAENKNGEFVATKWDMNTLGRHLITRVKHIFDMNTYKNEIETIKPYRLVDGSENGIKLSDFLKQGI